MPLDEHQAVVDESLEHEADPSVGASSELVDTQAGQGRMGVGQHGKNVCFNARRHRSQGVAQVHAVSPLTL